jgi:hypothetical protein
MKPLWIAFLMSNLFLLPPLAAHAGAEAPAFEVRQASLQRQPDGYRLNALIDIRLPGYIREAFEQGFDLPLMLEVELYRKRGWWLWDKRLSRIVHRYRLRDRSFYDNVRLLDLKTGESRYHDNLDEALSSLSVIYNEPLFDPAKLEPGRRYRLRLRFGIDQDELPIPLKSSSLWRNNWTLASDWYEWGYSP